MHHEELKSQCESIGHISREEYKKLLEMEKEQKKKLEERAKIDLVGMLYSLPDYFNVEEKTESPEETRIFGSLVDYLNEGNYSYALRDRVTELASDYGLAAEESGFRRGFKVAMRLCMEGMLGGTY